MKIKEILSRNRRDFEAIYICEHCGHTIESDGYDDAYFHNEVIPDWACEKCNKKSDSTYVPKKPKYEQNEVI